MPQSSQNPTRRDDLLLMLLHGGAATNSIATHVVDAFAAEVRAQTLRQTASEIDTSADEMERVLGRSLETSSVERGVANRLRRMADKIQGGGAS